MAFNPFMDAPKPRKHGWAIVRSIDRVTLATFEDLDVALSKLDAYGNPGAVEVMAVKR